MPHRESRGNGYYLLFLTVRAQKCGLVRAGWNIVIIPDDEAFVTCFFANLHKKVRGGARAREAGNVHKKTGTDNKKYDGIHSCIFGEKRI